MVNTLFVLIVFLLQLKKDYIHIRWSLGVTNTIEYDKSVHEVKIRRDYLRLEPIGLVFVMFFGVILGVQFISMLIHRFGTVSQILATTQLNVLARAQSNSSSLKGEAVDVAKRLQTPQEQWDERVLTAMERRGTVHKILFQHQQRNNFSDLETNFKRAYFKEGELNLGRLTVSRKTMTFIDTKRKSLIEQRSQRKSQIRRHPNSFGEDGNVGRWLHETQRNSFQPDLVSIPNGPIGAVYFNEAFEPDSQASEELEMFERPPRKSHVTFAQ